MLGVLSDEDSLDDHLGYASFLDYPLLRGTALTHLDAVTRELNLTRAAIVGTRVRSWDSRDRSSTAGITKGNHAAVNCVERAFSLYGENNVGGVKMNIRFSALTIPPTVNLKIAIPGIQQSKQRLLQLPLEREPLGSRAGNGRYSAMASLGSSGVNGHAGFEATPPTEPLKAVSKVAGIPDLLVAAELSSGFASIVGESLLMAMPSPIDTAAFATKVGRHPRCMAWRSFAGTGHPMKPPTFGKTAVECEAVFDTVFVFSGEGTQDFDMGRELFRTCVPFRESILDLDEAYASVTGMSLLESTGLFADSADHQTDTLGDPWPIAITLPAHTMLQLATVDALAAAGVRPAIIVGYSAGEIAVLSASGAASKLVALKLAIAQGQVLSLLEAAKGAMADISCTPDPARSIIAEVRAELGRGVLEIGCYNAPGALTLSGHEAHIDLAIAKATAAGIVARRIKTGIPAHSAMVKRCRAEFMESLSDIFPTSTQCVPKVPVYSSVLGGLFDGSYDAEYFWEGAVQPVLFQDAIEEMLLEYECATFVEIGPRPVLTDYVRSMTEDSYNVTINRSIRRR